MVGHVAPEASVGGPIAAVEEGDYIVIDIENRQLNLEVDVSEINNRIEHRSVQEIKYAKGVFAKYSRLVSQADKGAITG